MPWSIQERDGKYCVVKEGASNPVPGGCHASRTDAIKHQRALYAAEPNMTAAAPLAPPKAYFEMPEPMTPTPMTYTEDGRVYGHLALWNSCHTGFANGKFGECVTPPKSKAAYKNFHLGQIQTAEGDTVAIGKITFDTSHAPLTADVAVASQHYDHTGSVGAYVRASNGRLGIWLSGALRSDLPPEALVALRANPLSGDWRQSNGNLEMIGALAVPVPGFQVPQFALAASGEVASLILPPQDDWEVDVMPEFTAAQMRQKKMLGERALTAAVLSAETRNNLPESAFALSGRRYPIHDVAHARNALARSAGKPEAAQVRRAVCRRYPNMGECASK